jgi:ATP-binding cassette subfamily C exporter for protease/lipase
VTTKLLLMRDGAVHMFGPTQAVLNALQEANKKAVEAQAAAQQAAQAQAQAAQAAQAQAAAQRAAAPAPADVTGEGK